MAAEVSESFEDERDLNEEASVLSEAAAEVEIAVSDEPDSEEPDSEEMDPEDSADEIVVEETGELPADADLLAYDEFSEDGEGVEEDAGPREPSPYDRPGEWFVVHTYAGYENKVKSNLASRVRSMNMEERIFEVVIP